MQRHIKKYYFYYIYNMEMNCDFGIHEGIRDMGEVICPFCDNQIDDIVKKEDNCCYEQDLINDNGKIVCKNCGKVDSYGIIDEYIDFYENNRKIIRKSVYHRKYHIKNIINNITSDGKNVSVQNSLKICPIFKEIEKVLPQVNGNRKRMINTNFILKQLFKMFNLPHDNKTVTKSKRTLVFYERYWDCIMSLIGDKIELIIR